MKKHIIRLIIMLVLGALIAMYKDHLLEIAKGGRPDRPDGLVVPSIDEVLADVEKALVNPKWSMPDETNAHTVLHQHVQFFVKYGYVDELEELAERVRDPELQFPSGYTYLDTFYRAAKSLPILSPEEYANPYRYWAKKKKKSVAAHIALAEAYLNLAWNARQPGDLTVGADGKPESWTRRIQQAELAVEKAEKLDDDEAHLYVTRMWVNLGLGKRGPIAGDFKRAVKARPQCYPAYLARAVSLLPGNGGKKDEWTEFARTAGEKYLPDTKNTLYAYLVTAVKLHFASNETGFEADRFHTGVLKWDEVNAAFRDFTNARPNSAYVLNRYARMAFDASEPEVVAHVVQRLGDQIEKSVIQNEWLYNAYKDFANLPRQMVSARPVKVIYTDPYESVMDVTFSNDGEIMAIGDGGGNVTVWNMNTLRKIRHLKPPVHLSAESVDFSPDRKWLGVAHGNATLKEGRGTVAFWNTTTWELSRQIRTGEMPSSVSFTDDNKQAMVTAFRNEYQKPAEMYFIDLRTFAVQRRDWGIRTVFHKPKLLSGPKQMLMAAVGNTMFFVDLNKGQPIGACVGSNRAEVECHSTIWDYEFSPNRQVLAVGGGPIHTEDWGFGRLEIWNTRTYQPIQRMPAETIAGMNAIAWSPDGKHLFAGGHDEAVTMWDPFTFKKKAILLGHQGPITGLTLSPDKKHLASASSDGSVRIWDITQLN